MERTIPTFATLTVTTIGLGVILAVMPAPHDPRTIPTPTDTVANHACDAGSCTPQTVDQLPQEDDPNWDCATMGNRICADPAHVHASDAWKAWDAANGWRYLKADPDLENRVEYVGTATLPPHVDESRGYGAIPARDGWYVFRAVPVDLATVTTSAVNGK